MEKIKSQQKVVEAVLNKKGEVHVTFSQQERNTVNDTPENSEYKKKTDAVPHKDLLEALSNLAPHILFSLGFAEVSEYDCHELNWYTGWQWKDVSLFANIDVTKVKFIGKEGVDGIKIYGTQTTERDDVIKIESPNIYFDLEDENKYPLVKVIDAMADTLRHELLAFANGTKAGGQLNLFKQELEEVA